MITDASLRTFHSQGYLLCEGILSDESIDILLKQYLSCVYDITGILFSDAYAPELASYFKQNRKHMSQVYDEIRAPDYLQDFSTLHEIVSVAKLLLQDKIALLRKIPFRIDLPYETKELAVWHQDYFYVRGSMNTITAWIPLQDVRYLNGCLTVMPQSHKFGPIEHDVHVLKKKYYPSNIFNNDVRYVEMKKGDVLFFNSCLLHSSNLNISECIRYSVQARYISHNDVVDEGMKGKLIIK